MHASEFWTIALIPTAIFLAGVDAQDVASAAAVFNLLGRLTGVIGLALLLLAAALSARVPGFDQPFGGLTKLWHTHHLLGAGSLMLLLVHPIFFGDRQCFQRHQHRHSYAIPATVGLGHLERLAGPGPDDGISRTQLFLFRQASL